MFTIEQLKEIENYFKLSAKKDSDFILADLPLDGSEYVAIVQNGENRKLYLSTLITIMGGDITVVPAPAISIDRYGTVKITAPIGNIYYTIDGSVPDTESTLYQGEFQLSSFPATVKAIAVYNEVESTVAEATYNAENNIKMIYWGYCTSYNYSDANATMTGSHAYNYSVNEQIDFTVTPPSVCYMCMLLPVDFEVERILSASIDITANFHTGTPKVIDGITYLPWVINDEILAAVPHVYSINRKGA